MLVEDRLTHPKGGKSFEVPFRGAEWEHSELLWLHERIARAERFDVRGRYRNHLADFPHDVWLQVTRDPLVHFALQFPAGWRQAEFFVVVVAPWILKIDHERNTESFFPSRP